MSNLKALNGIRALATIGIFLFHAGFLLKGTFPVTLFFMLSGFCMYYSKSTSEEYPSFLAWLTKYVWIKFKQFYPLHFFTLLIAVLLTGGIEDKITPFFLQLTLTQSFVEEYALTFNALAWYLSITMFLYVIGWFLIKIVHSIKNIFFVCFTCILLIEVINLTGYNGYLNPFYRLLDFLLGMMIAKIYLSKKITIRNSSLSECICALLFLVQYLILLMSEFPVLPGYFTIIFSIALFLFAEGKGIISNVLCKPFFQKIAYYSFPFYMIHELILRIFRRVFSNEEISYLLRCTIIALPSLMLSVIFAFIWKTLSVKYRPTTGKNNMLI